MAWQVRQRSWRLTPMRRRRLFLRQRLAQRPSRTAAASQPGIERTPVQRQLGKGTGSAVAEAAQAADVDPGLDDSALGQGADSGGVADMDMAAGAALRALPWWRDGQFLHAAGCCN